jgi:hypothetical protein
MKIHASHNKQQINFSKFSFGHVVVVVGAVLCCAVVSVMYGKFTMRGTIRPFAEIDDRVCWLADFVWSCLVGLGVLIRVG